MDLPGHTSNIALNFNDEGDSCYSISFEHEVETGEMDLHQTVSSTNTPRLTLVFSLVFVT